MSKKLFELINGITTAVATAAVAWVTYNEPVNATAINSAIGIAAGAVTGICILFVKNEKPEQSEKK